jgi:DNA-binding PadR family transcriptional regulator
MVSVKDVVLEVASRGAASLEELEQAFEADWMPLLPALDACIDHGFLRLVWRKDPTLDLPYRVTARGKRLLDAARFAAAAA